MLSSLIAVIKLYQGKKITGLSLLKKVYDPNATDFCVWIPENDFKKALIQDVVVGNCK